MLNLEVYTFCDCIGDMVLEIGHNTIPMAFECFYKTDDMLDS
jgi:hypothetical protein